MLFKFKNSNSFSYSLSYLNSNNTKMKCDYIKEHEDYEDTKKHKANHAKWKAMKKSNQT